MVYKIVYVEDQTAQTVIHDLNEYGLETIHCNPTSFKETITNIEGGNPDLILMDFRLKEGSEGGEVDAPAFAQYYRSLIVDNPQKSIPIVLLSNDDKIHDFYQDFTSHDLFDFSIKKSKLSSNLKKYTDLMKELIESYKEISTSQSTKSPLVNLLKMPSELKNQIDPRVERTLKETKFVTNIYMASSFILDNIVKPVGILIGEDVLAARIGVSKDSSNWSALCEELNPFKYQGIYSKTYKRWWAEGVEMWWRTNVEENMHLRRVSSKEKLSLLKSKYSSLNIQKVDGDPTSVTEKFWTICHKTFIPVDPSEAFEAKSELSEMPWIERKYYSYDSVKSDQNIKDLLTGFEKTRFKEKAQRSNN